MFYQHILVPLDASRFAESALPHALAIAERGEGRIELVAVFGDEPLTGYIEAMRTVSGEPPESREKQASSYLDRLVERLDGARRGVSSTVLAGDVAEAIDAHARDTGAGLIVMATHGHGPISRAWLGSVADRLLRFSSVPLLLIRPDEADEPDFGELPAYRHILVPLDGSDRAEEVLDLAVPLGALHGARFTLVLASPILLQVDAPDMAATLPLDPTLVARARDEAGAYLERVAERLRKRDIECATAVLDGLPAEVINAHAAEHGADMIALTTRGLGGLSRLLLGSVADKLIRSAQMPVLVHAIHPGNDSAHLH